MTGSLRKKIIMYLCIMAAAIQFICPVNVISAARKSTALERVTEYSDSTRKDINKSIKKKKYGYKKRKGDNYVSYFDASGALRKTIEYPASGETGDNSILCPDGYTCEYYYNEKQELIYVYAHKKIVTETKTRTKKCRVYIGMDQLIYRYTDSDGNTKAYKTGVKKSKYKLAGRLLTAGYTVVQGRHM